MRKLLALVWFCICLCCAQKTVDQVARDQSCSTSNVIGLSTQLIAQMNCLAPGSMETFEGAAGISYNTGVFPYLQSPAVAALKKVGASSGKTLVVTSALRTLAQQFLLYRWWQLGLCGITAAAAPGNSNHNGGLAVDVSGYSDWITPMGRNSWKWFGNGDKVHFTFTGSGTKDVRSLSVKAFQRLWNLNNPRDQISEDGNYGPATELRLQRSPSGGFPVGASCSGPTTGTPADTTPQSCKVGSQAGVCMDTAQCDGTSTPGYCPGAKNIQCCTDTVYIQAITSCVNAANQNGVCQDVSTCSGASFAGFCPGPNNVQCCVASASPPASGKQTTNQHGIDLIKSYEGYYANFYIDPVGIKTIGYGHACHVADCNNLQAKNSAGNFYKVNPPLTRVQAEDLLRGDLEKGAFEQCVRDRVVRNINDDQFSSLVSFVFNVGCGGFDKSTLLKRVNANLPLEGTSGVRAAFLMWNKAGGKVLTGLTRRRNAEADLYGGKLTVNSKKRYATDGVGEECWYQGEKGVCAYTNDCTGYNIAGLCPGPNDVKCCLRGKCSSKTTNDGICVMNTMCAGTVNSTQGLCQGATDLNCCVGPITEKTISCPDGAWWDRTNKWCANDDWVYGPFTSYMVQRCQDDNHGDICTAKILVTVDGIELGLPQWNKDLALSVRGSADCPTGSKSDTNFMGMCVETVGNTTTGATSVTVVGALEADVKDACSSFDAGISCATPQWNGNFYRSLAQPAHLAIILDDESGELAPDEGSNVWVSEQQKYSNMYSTDGAVIAGSYALLPLFSIVFYALLLLC